MLFKILNLLKFSFLLISVLCIYNAAVLGKSELILGGILAGITYIVYNKLTVLDDD
jgi:hypothetical protein